MRTKMLSVALALALALSALACPAALASGSGSARTALAGANENKLNNIALAVEAVNGTRLAGGETFSFNAVVGARTRARGYRSAVNGRGVNVTGGGVAQVATTLYLALLELQDGVRFDSLATYGARFRDSYVSDGRQAVITDYGGDIDFRFTNLGADMTIAMWTDASWLYCDITTDGTGFGGSWFDSWPSPAPTAFAFMAQTVSARIPLGGDGDVLNNIALAAGSVYDTTLAGGDVFSFNGVVGPRTGEYGYVSAVNGRGVNVTGGGVAQVASAIWLAVKGMDDIAVLEKSTYGGKYNQHYVERAEDAIATDYARGLDFSFRYTGDGTITIYTYVAEGALCCDVVRN